MIVRHTGSIVWAGVLAASLASAGCGGADQKAPSPRAQAQAAYHPSTPAEIDAFTQQLSPMLSRSPVQVRVVNAPGGVATAVVDSGFQNVMIARTNPDGSRTHACVESVEQARAFLAAPTVKPEKEVR